MFVQTAGLLSLICCLLFGLVIADYDEAKFREIVIDDHTNDDAIGLTTQQLLNRSGFSYEEYYVLALDGYITQLLRIINPLADRTKLKQPPILVFHGANIDTSCYLMASSKQHHPEKYPRTAEDGPMTSSNRSLGFVLANNGYDVWLIAQRGSNPQNFGHTKNAFGINRVPPGANLQQANISSGEDRFARLRSPFYWQYGIDDVVAFEIKNQIDKVIEVTNASDFSVFSFSLSTPTTLAFMALYPEYARRTRVYFQMAPAITADHFTAFDTLYFEVLCNLAPTRGIGFFPFYTTNPLLREVLLGLSEDNTLRYTAVYSLFTNLLGPSPIYLTNIERNVISRVLQPVSFKTVQQYCQQSISKKFQKFNYGALANQLIYGVTTPPTYNVSHVEVQNYVIVSGTNDGLASPATVARVMRTVSSTKPIENIVAPLFNHVDMVAAVETDKYVNFPVLKTLDKYRDQD